MNGVELAVRGMGPCPAFKNSKLLCRGRLITKPEYKKWMEACVQSFVSQCISGTATSGGGILMGLSQPFSIALLPQDDNWQEIPELAVWARLVPKGLEGATITIERIT